MTVAAILPSGSNRSNVMGMRFGIEVDCFDTGSQRLVRLAMRERPPTTTLQAGEIAHSERITMLPHDALEFAKLLTRSAHLALFGDPGTGAIGGTVEGEHTDEGVRVIDEVDVHAVSSGWDPSTPWPTPAPAARRAKPDDLTLSGLHARCANLERRVADLAGQLNAIRRVAIMEGDREGRGVEVRAALDVDVGTRDGGAVSRAFQWLRVDPVTHVHGVPVQQPVCRVRSEEGEQYLAENAIRSLIGFLHDKLATAQRIAKGEPEPTQPPKPPRSTGD